MKWPLRSNWNRLNPDKKVMQRIQNSTSPGAQGAAANAPAGATAPKSKIQLLLDQLRASQEEAKQANLQRYAEIAGGYQDRFNRGMQTVNTLGAQEQADVRDNYHDRLAATRQNLAARGLSGTTIAPTMAMGNTREMNADLARSRERIAELRLNTDARLSGDLLGFKERREDPYPDMGMYAQLAQQLGRGSGPARTTVTRSSNWRGKSGAKGSGIWSGGKTLRDRLGSFRSLTRR